LGDGTVSGSSILRDYRDRIISIYLEVNILGGAPIFVAALAAIIWWQDGPAL
jgi:hypothetical protein